METASYEGILAFIRQNTNIPGVGTKSWEELIPQNPSVDLSNPDPILDWIAEEYEASPADPDLDRFLDWIATFSEEPDPVWEVVLPGTVGPGVVNPIRVGGETAIRGRLAKSRDRGPRAYVKNLLFVKTRWWVVTDGTVEFVLMEGNTSKGPWNLERKRFTLRAGDPPKDYTFKPSEGRKRSWWLLKVKAPLVASQFSARPFRS
jgi:hypothetical protein